MYEHTNKEHFGPNFNGAVARNFGANFFEKINASRFQCSNLIGWVNVIGMQ